jgi:hypothetical protein
MTMNFKAITNGEAILIEDIPHLSFDEFSAQAIESSRGAARWSSFLLSRKKAPSD